MNSEPFGPTDTGKYCQILKTWGKTDFLPKKWVKRRKNGPKMSWFGMVWFVMAWL